MDPIDYQAIFLTEGRAALENARASLKRLSQNPQDGAAVDGAYRQLHTFKAMADTLGQEALVELAHAVETTIDNLRARALAPEPGLVALWLVCVDALDAALDRFAGDQRHAELQRELDGWNVRLAAQAPPVTAQAKAVVRPFGEAPAGPGPRRTYHVAVALDPSCLMKSARALMITSTLGIYGDITDVEPSLEELEWPDGSDAFSLTLRTSEAPEAIEAALAGTSDVASVRVTRFRPAGEVREAVPAASLFDRYRAVVPELAGRLGKEVALTVEGGETPVVGGCAEPVSKALLHLLRNALDHGLEPPDERRAAGKTPVGALRLSAREEAGGVVITVADDGRGIAPALIREKAVRKGLLSPEEAGRLGDAAALELVWRPGFSTRDTVTRLSGRGVGLDAVKDAIEAIGGAIRIESAPGRGTTFVIRIPACSPAVSRP